MMMNANQKRTLMLAGIIGTLFACYDEDEKTRLHKELHARIGKGVRKMVKRYGKQAVIDVSHTQGNVVWGDAVDHFAERKITIEASACILELWAKDEKALAKHFGLSSGKLEKWQVPTTREDAVYLEGCSREVANYVWSKINALYGIEESKKMSVLERIAAHKKMKESA